MPKTMQLKLPFHNLDLTVIQHAKYNDSANMLSHHTRRNLLGIAKQFNSYLEENQLKISPATIKSFLAHLKHIQAQATWNLSRQNLKKVLKLQPQVQNNYLARMMVEEVFREIKPIAIESKIVDYLTRAEVEMLIKKSSLRLGLIISFLFVTGCRISEMIRIRLIDVSASQNIAIRILGKGSKSRRVFIPMKLFTAIRDEFRGTDWLFETKAGIKYNRSVIWRKIKRAGHDILAKDIHPHLLRHSTANYLLQECGRSANYVAEYLGHADPATTLNMYIHEKPTAEEITAMFG